MALQAVSKKTDLGVGHIGIVPGVSKALDRAVEQIARLNANMPHDWAKKDARAMASTLCGAEHIRARYGSRFRPLSSCDLAGAIAATKAELTYERAMVARRGCRHPSDCVKNSAVLIFLRTLRRFSPESFKLAIARGTTRWDFDLPEYRGGVLVEPLPQAAE